MKFFKIAGIRAPLIFILGIGLVIYDYFKKNDFKEA